MLYFGLCLKQALLKIEHFVFWQNCPVSVHAAGDDKTVLNEVKISHIAHRQILPARLSAKRLNGPLNGSSVQAVDNQRILEK